MRRTRAAELATRQSTATRERGRQEFKIGVSEVWLAGNTLGKTKDLELLEELFDQMGKRVGVGAT